MKCSSSAAVLLITLIGGCLGGPSERRSISVSPAKPETVDFSYAFSTPHRITVCLPNSMNKTLLDAYPDYLRMAWTYDNLLDKPLGSFTTPRTNWEVRITAEVDGKKITRTSWRRSEGWLPALDYAFQDSAVTVHLEILGGESAAISRVEVKNNDDKPHSILLRCEKPGGLTGYNPAWVQSGWDANVLLAGWQDRADRIIVFAIGGDEQPVTGPTTLAMKWHLAAHEQKSGWLIRPYRAYHPMLPGLVRSEWSEEFAAAKKTWHALLQKAAAVIIPDSGVQNAFNAGLADCFVMREQVAEEYIAGPPGTEGYRAPGSGEPAIVAVLLDQLGLHTEAVRGFQLCIDQQGPDGNWCDPLGWGHYWWAAGGFKSWAIMEHYRLTGDKNHLAAVYPRMLASSRWQETQRRRTRTLINGARPLTYGLMPRGMGDCGLKDEDDLYGVFIPHNLWTVFADACALQAAKILDQKQDVEELNIIHATALADLLKALENGAISENGYRWIPGVPGKTCGSRWGALNAVFPLGILPRDHELVTGTIQKIESRISPGGIPINTGWMKDGMWVAITLDNLAEVLLLRGESDRAVNYLYATLNHGTPLYSWCEERGPEPGSKEITGDRQHLWTPLAVCRFIRDALVQEDGDTLHLARGAARQWLNSGRLLGVENMMSHFGAVSYKLRYSPVNRRVQGEINLDRDIDAKVILHLRLPGGRKIKRLGQEAGAEIGLDRETIEWQGMPRSARFTVTFE